MISVAILEDGCKSYNYRILPQLSLQILIACSSLQRPRHSVFLFLQLQFFGCWTGCGDLRRFIAINRWIILLKSGNQNIKFLSNHLQFLKRLPTVTSPQSTVILL